MVLIQSTSGQVASYNTQTGRTTTLNSYTVKTASGETVTRYSEGTSYSSPPSNYVRTDEKGEQYLSVYEKEEQDVPQSSEVELTPRSSGGVYDLFNQLENERTRTSQNIQGGVYDLLNEQKEQKQSILVKTQPKFYAPTRETSVSESSVPEQPKYLSVGTAYRNLDKGGEFNFIPAKPTAENTLSTTKPDFQSQKPQSFMDKVGYKQAKAGAEYNTNPSDTKILTFYGISAGKGFIETVTDFGIIKKTDEGIKLKPPFSETVKGTFETVTNPVGAVRSIQANPVKSLGETTGSAIAFIGFTKIATKVYNFKMKRLTSSEAKLVKQFYEPTRKVGTVDVFTEPTNAKVTNVINKQVELKGFKPKPQKIKASFSNGEIVLKDVSNFKKGKGKAYVEASSTPKLKEIEIFNYGKNLKEYVNIDNLGNTNIITQRVINNKVVVGKATVNKFGKGTAQLFDVKGKPLTKPFEIQSPKGNIKLSYNKEVSYLKSVDRVSDVKLIEKIEQRTQSGGTTVERIKPYRKGTSTLNIVQDVRIKSGVGLDKPFTQVSKGKQIIDLKQSLPNIEKTKSLTVYDKNINTDINTAKGKVRITDINAVKNKVILSDTNKFNPDIIDVRKGFKSVENPTVIRTNTAKVNIQGYVEINKPYSKRLGSVQRQKGLNRIYQNSKPITNQELKAGMDFLFNQEAKPSGVYNQPDLTPKKLLTINKEKLVSNQKIIQVQDKIIKADVELPKNIQATLENPRFAEGVKSKTPILVKTPKTKTVNNNKQEIFISERQIFQPKEDIIRVSKGESIFKTEQDVNKEQQRIYITEQEARSNSRIINVAENRQEQIQEQVIDMASPRNETPYIFKPVTPPKIPKIETPKVVPLKSDKVKGGLFTLQVRERGKFKEAGTFQNVSEAFRKGVFITGQTAKASFKILSEKGQEFKTGLSDIRYTTSKRNPNVYVQKRRYRISSLGEKAEISKKGREAQRLKAKGLRRFFI